MSDEVFTEYRAVWPNGDEVWEGSHDTNHAEFMENLEDLLKELTKLGVPSQGHPRVEFRTVTVTRITTEWDTVNPGNKPKHADTQPLVTSGPAYENQGSIVSPIMPTLGWQLEQVAKHNFRFSDPCIICAGDFAICGHTTAETQMVINRIKREHHV